MKNMEMPMTTSGKNNEEEAENKTETGIGDNIENNDEFPDIASEALQETPEVETGEKTTTSAEKMTNNITSMRYEITNGNLSRWNEIRDMSYNDAMMGNELQPYEKLQLHKFVQKGEKISKPLPGVSLKEWTRQIAIKAGEKKYNFF